MTLSENDALLLEELEMEYGKDVLSNAIITIAANAAGDENVASNSIILDYIKLLEGMRIRFRELHWEADKKSRHTLAEDVIDAIDEYEDEIAEDYMGMIGIKIKVGEVVPTMPQSTDINALDELLSATLGLLGNLSENSAYTGICNILEEFVHKIEKFKYLATLS